jgi:hypothetical protein
MAARREAVLDYYEDSFRSPVAQPSGRVPRRPRGRLQCRLLRRRRLTAHELLRSPLSSMFSKTTAGGSGRRVQAPYFTADATVA